MAGIKVNYRILSARKETVALVSGALNEREALTLFAKEQGIDNPRWLGQRTLAIYGKGSFTAKADRQTTHCARRGSKPAGMSYPKPISNTDAATYELTCEYCGARRELEFGEDSKSQLVVRCEDSESCDHRSLENEPDETD